METSPLREGADAPLKLKLKLIDGLDANKVIYIRLPKDNLYFTGFASGFKALASEENLICYFQDLSDTVDRMLDCSVTQDNTDTNHLIYVVQSKDALQAANEYILVIENQNNHNAITKAGIQYPV